MVDSCELALLCSFFGAVEVWVLSNILSRTKIKSIDIVLDMDNAFKAQDVRKIAHRPRATSSY